MEDKFKDEGKRRLNVNGVLRILGVSRNGYYSFKKRLPSDRQQTKGSNLKQESRGKPINKGMANKPSIFGG